MDGRSWMLHAANGNMRGGDTVRCSWAFAGDNPGLRCDEQEAMMSSQGMAMQQQLSQIYMLMDMEEHDGQYATVAPPLSSSSSFRSFSGTSQDENSSSLLLTATSTAAAASCQNHHPEVSSQTLPTYEYLSPVGASGASAGVGVPNPEYSICHQEDQAQPGQARCRSRSGGHGAAACAFRPYSRCLGPKKKLRPGGTAGGQRAIKTAMSVLSKMHAARLSQYYQIMEMASAAHALPSPAAAASRCDNNSQLQLQHVLSERKRREKLNDSFRALRAVLPPASKKDKASVLIRAKDYVNTLMARITELEEKNKMLAESQHHAGDGDGEQDDEAVGNRSTEAVDIGGSAKAEGTLPGQCQELHLKIVLGSSSSSSSSGCSAMDAVAGILQGLNEMRDANLLAMNRGSTSGSNGRLPRANTTNTTQRSTVRLKLKSGSCDEKILKESVIKIVKDVMQPEIVTP